MEVLKFCVEVNFATQLYQIKLSQSKSVEQKENKHFWWLKLFIN